MIVTPRVVLAPDSFKECMSARRAALAMRAGVRAAVRAARCDLVPLSDGGEGLVATLAAATGAGVVEVTVTGPLGRPVRAGYGYLDRDRLAIIEVAAATGIALVRPSERDPRVTTSYGVGELIIHALDRGARRFIVGLGGTSTNDGGAGLLQALGARLIDATGADLRPGGLELVRLRAIDRSGLDPRLASARFDLASDVVNPLLGESGATRTFGPQKGASASDLEALEEALANLAAVAHQQLGISISDRRGAGAAGGLGAAFLGFLPATFHRGIDLVIAATGLEGRIAAADLVLTGEGRIDGQSLMGKALSGVAALAERYRVPVIGFAGQLGPGAAALLDRGFHMLVPINPPAGDLGAALRDGPRNLQRAVTRTGRRWFSGSAGPRRE